MSLLGSTTPAGANFETLPEIAAMMDDSLPSLYLFEQETEPWRSDPDLREVTGDYLPATNLKVRSSLREWFDHNDQAFGARFGWPDKTIIV
jgi:hypothetical protein